MRKSNQHSYSFQHSLKRACRKRRLIISLLVLLFAVSIGAPAVMGQGNTEIVIYNGDNGDFGSVTVQFKYRFEGTKMKYTVTQVIVGFSYKMRDNEPELFKEVQSRHLLTTTRFYSSLEADFNGQVGFGLTKLKLASAPIHGKIYGIGKPLTDYFNDPPGAEPILRDYHNEHQRNLYTDHATLSVGGSRLSNLHIYDLEKAIDDLRTQLASDKRELQRQFDSKITQASLQSNLSKFDEAEARLREAYDLIKGNRERKSKYEATKKAIEQRKQSEQQKKQAIADREKQKQIDAEKKQQQMALDKKKAAAAQAGAQASKTSHQPQQARQQQQMSQGHQTASGKAATRPMTAYERARQAALLKKQQQQLEAERLAEQKRIAQEKKAEETRRRIQKMKEQMEETRRNAERLDAAADESIEGMASAGNDPIATLNAAKPLAMEFARQGSAAGAYGTIGVAAGMGFLKMLGGNRKRKEAERAAAQERERIREQQEAARRKREAEEARLRKEAFDLMIQGRYTVLSTFNQSDPIPLSTSTVAADTVYYFIYAIDSSSFQTARTNVYVSNVFAVHKYHDGTWPYQSRVVREISPLTPHREIMQGYYIDKAEAEKMREAFVSGFSMSEGVALSEIEYKKERLAAGETSGGTDGPASEVPASGSGLGIPLGPPARTAGHGDAHGAEKSGGLGVPMSPAPKKQKTEKTTTSSADNSKKSGDANRKADTGGSGGLGIPIR